MTKNGYHFFRKKYMATPSVITAPGDANASDATANVV